MKIHVIGSDHFAFIIKGFPKSGNLVILRHRGKVKKGVIIRTKGYNQFLVSYDFPSVVILGESHRIKGPINKGIREEIRALSQLEI